MPNFIMIMGISGSGKTTYARSHYPNATLIDSDEVREELFGDATIQTNNTKVFDTMWKRTVTNLKNGNDVVYCATNLSTKRRGSLVSRLRGAVPKTYTNLVIMITPIAICLKNNLSRDRHVPEDVIWRQLKAFQLPLEYEDWDSIYIDAACNAFKESRAYWREKVDNFGSQNNPHHTLTLAEHLESAALIAKTLNYSPSVYFAAKYHDIGKAVTCEFDDNGVAHYYGHENVSAYAVLNCGSDYHIATLVNYHMLPYKSEHEQEIWKERCGETLWNELIQLHNCDEGAH